MKQKSNTKPILLIGFSIVLLLLGTLIALSVASINENQKQVSHIEEDSKTERLAFDMRDGAHMRALILYRMAVTSDPFERDNMWIEFKYEAQKVQAAIEAIRTMGIDDETRVLLDQVLKTVRPGAKIQNEAAELILDENLQAAYDSLNSQVIPIQNTVMESLEDLLSTVRGRIDNDLTHLSLKNHNAILVISIIGSIAMLLGIIIAIYVTRRITLSENAFFQQKEIAEQANRAKSLFLANMSHEIRSPLTAIIGFSETILNRDMPSDKKNELTVSIIRNSKHLYQIINDILDISKIEAGQLDIEILDTNLFKLLTEIESLVKLNAEKKQLSFKINYAFPLPESFQTDPTRIKQILLNLIGNAIKFTESGGVSVFVTCDAIKNKIQFKVIDTGIGMTAHQTKKLFSPFTQADSSTTRKFGGTGLGLSISKRLVEQLGGNLICVSEIGRGSAFSFSVEAGDLSKARFIDSIEQVEAGSTVSINNLDVQLSGRVLLAEDTLDNQKLIEMYVTDTGAEIVMVDNGKKAVERCLSEKFDLVLMDMQMPVMDGVEAITQIRAAGCKVPIVSLTANAMKSDMEKCFTAGANDFLSKPIDLLRFNHMLAQYLTPAESIKKQIKSSGKMQKIIDRFIEDLPGRLAKINAFKENSDWENVHAETHKLKGLGKPMGFPELTEVCEKINNYCRESNFDAARDALGSLNEKITAILQTGK